MVVLIIGDHDQVVLYVMDKKMTVAIEMDCKTQEEVVKRGK